MSDTSMIELIKGTLTLLTTLLMGLLAYYTAKLNTKTDTIHSLVNSSFSLSLKTSMIAQKRVAELTKNKDDIASAELSEKAYNDHEAQQAKVDAQNKTKV